MTVLHLGVAMANLLLGTPAGFVSAIPSASVLIFSEPGA
jgi:hypothetical protein